MNDPLVGQTLDGRYRVGARIAVGGMATVYRALDTRLDRELALKVMHPALASDQGFVDRFIREAKAVARLSHPNVVGVHDQGTDGSYVFLAMEYVAGCTLRDILRERGALHPRAALDILEPILAALGAAHRSGLVHRDVKPENVLIGDDGRVKVADFGLVRAVGSATATTTAGSVIGTVSYLSPEQVEHGNVDARSDVYACGVMLHEMLTGSKPHEGDTAVQVIYRHLNHDVPPPSRLVPGLAPELDELVTRAAARSAADRPGDAVELLALLQAARRSLSPAQLDAEPPTAATRPAGDTHTTRLRRTPVTPPTAAATGAAAGSGPGGPSPDGAEPLNRTSRLQLPPELAGRRAEAADHPVGPLPAPSRFASRRGLLAVFAAVAALVGIGAVVWFIGVGRYTSTPSVLGLSRVAAEAELEDSGLDAEFTEVFSETIPVGKVVSTDPRNGERVRNGGTVTVAVSKGPERIDVPKVAGDRKRDAERVLEEARLTVGTERTAFSDTVPRGRVIGTEPAAGTRLKPDAPVSLVISRGAPVDVPDLVGLTLEEARQELADAGLELRTAGDEVYSDDVDKGSVAAQTPDAGATSAEGSSVTLTVSKGPQLFEVPDVKGKKQGEARQILEDAGFEVDVFDALPLFGDDKVWRQSPGGGSLKPRGTTIDLTVR